MLADLTNEYVPSEPCQGSSLVASYFIPFWAQVPFHIAFILC